jgi:asparagine N-glycosylation enzyme membrane subunit Stt3
VDPSVFFIVCKRGDPGAFFVLIWSVLIIFAIIQRVRREYYVAVSIAPLAAIFVGWMFIFVEMDVFSIFRRKNGVSLIICQKKRNRSCN